MGRAGRWLKGILGMNKDRNVGGDDNNSDDDFEIASFSSCDNPSKEKTRWSFSSKSYNVPAVGSSLRPRLSLSAETKKKRNERASSKAALTAEAILRLTADGGRERRAALRVQSVFRGFLARKALKALKGVVILQALIRGYMVRKDSAAAVRRMQARAVAGYQCPRRLFNKENVFGTANRLRRSIERISETRSSFHSKGYSIRNQIGDEISDASPKIVKVDTVKPLHFRLLKLERKDLRDVDLRLPSTARGSSLSRCYVRSREPISPARSTCGECTALEKPVCPDYPNYMASTRSFEAKSRSTSNPKQKLSEGPRRRFALQEITATRNSVSAVDLQRSFSHYEHFMF